MSGNHKDGMLRMPHMSTTHLLIYNIRLAADTSETRNRFSHADIRLSDATGLGGGK